MTEHQAPSENPLRVAAMKVAAEAGFPDSQTPFIDAFMSKWPHGGGAHVEVIYPADLYVDVSRWSDTLNMATLRIGGVKFTHKPDDMRSLLLAALEWLDFSEAILSSTTPRLAPDQEAAGGGA